LFVKFSDISEIFRHEFVNASPIAYDHGCIPIGWCEH